MLKKLEKWKIKCHNFFRYQSILLKFGMYINRIELDFFVSEQNFLFPKAKKLFRKNMFFFLPFFDFEGGITPLGFNFSNFHWAFLKSGNINLSEKVSVKSLLGLGEWVSTNRIGLQLGLQKNGFECPASSCPWCRIKPRPC